MLCSDFSTTSVSAKASTHVVAALRAVFVDLDGIDFQYQALFDPNTISSVSLFCCTTIINRRFQKFDCIK